MFRQSNNEVSRIWHGTSLVLMSALLIALPVFGKHKQQAKAQKTTPIVGRVLAWRESLALGAGLGPKWRTLRDQHPYLKQYNTGAGGPANSPNPQGGIIIKK